jgi:hypothetical protein
MDATQQQGKQMKVFSLFGAWIEGQRELLGVFAEFSDMIVFTQNNYNYNRSMGYDSLVYIESELGKDSRDNEEIEV